MQAAGVILGILPTVLSLAGSSTLESGVLSLRRPFLAFLLSAGSPAVNPTRAFDYKDPSDIVQIRPKALQNRTPTARWKKWLICAAEYFFASGAVFSTTYDFAHKTAPSFAPQTAYTPLVWAYLAVAVHLFGALGVYLRMQLIHAKTKSLQSDGLWAWLKSLWAEELVISGDQVPARLVIKQETKWFLFIAWFTSTGTVLHIILGTLVFSAILFISTSDAVYVAARYFVSTMVCRIVLAYELSGVRQQVQIEDGGYHGPIDQLDPIRPPPGHGSYAYDPYGLRREESYGLQNLQREDSYSFRGLQRLKSHSPPRLPKPDRIDSGFSEESFLRSYDESRPLVRR